MSDRVAPRAWIVALGVALSSAASAEPLSPPAAKTGDNMVVEGWASLPSRGETTSVAYPPEMSVPDPRKLAAPDAADVSELGSVIVVTGSNLVRFVGRYALNGTIATVSLTDDGHLSVALTGQSSGPPLRKVGRNEFVADDVGVRLFFEGDGPRSSRIRSRFRGGEGSGTRIADEAAADAVVDPGTPLK